MDRYMKLVLTLAAIDNLSPVVARATGASVQRINSLKSAAASLASANATMGIGIDGLRSMKSSTEAFQEMEAAGNRLKVSMMGEGGALNAKAFRMMQDRAESLSDKYAQSTATYLDMFRVLKNNGMEVSDIMGQIGESAEKLSVALEAPPASTAEFVAHMKRDMGVANKDMMGMMDLINRMHKVGVGKTGEETINEMNQFFSKEGLSAAIMNSLGLEQAKQVAAISGVFIRRGLSGQTVGTNFRRMIDTMRNEKALKEVNSEASKYGIKLDLFSQGGQFKGFANMIAEFDKMKNLPVQTIEKITKSFGGKQGLSTDFIALIAKEGVHEFNTVMQEMYKKSTLSQDVAVMLQGLAYKNKQLGASWTNLKAKIGGVIAIGLAPLIVRLRELLIHIRNFMVEHPRLAKFLVTLFTFANVAVIIFGVVKALKAVAMAMRILGMASLTNPFLLAVTAIAVVASLVITYWDKIGPFFKRLWSGVTSFFKSAISIVGDILTILFSPARLIFNKWSPLPKFFKWCWNLVIAIFKGVVKFVWDLGSSFFKAGWNIVVSIAKGIKNGAVYAIQAIKSVAKSIRDHLPFSPAKEGPLRDIHRIKLVETIAETVNPNSIIAKMRKIGQAIFDYAPQSGPGSRGQLSVAPIVLHIDFHPEYHAAPGSNPQSDEAAFLAMMTRNKDQLMRMISMELKNNLRLGF